MVLLGGAAPQVDRVGEGTRGRIVPSVTCIKDEEEKRCGWLLRAQAVECPWCSASGSVVFSQRTSFITCCWLPSTDGRSGVLGPWTTCEHSVAKKASGGSVPLFPLAVGVSAGLLVDGERSPFSEISSGGGDCSPMQEIMSSQRAVKGGDGSGLGKNPRPLVQREGDTSRNTLTGTVSEMGLLDCALLDLMAGGVAEARGGLTDAVGGASGGSWTGMMEQSAQIQKGTTDSPEACLSGWTRCAQLAGSSLGGGSTEDGGDDQPKAEL